MNIKVTYLAIFILTAIAILLIGGLDRAIGAELRRGKKAVDMKPKKKTPLTKITQLEKKRQLLIEETGIRKPVYWLLTGLGAAGGAAVGKMFFHENFFAVMVGVLGMLSPLLYLNFRLTRVKSANKQKLLSSMMLLSNSYIVTEDLLKTIGDNIDLLEHPAPFRDFLTYVSLIDGNVKTGLRRMEYQVDNPYFSQWVNALIMSQDDRNMKYVTMSVVDAMVEVHQAQMESDTAMYAIWREYLTVLTLIFSVPVIFRLLMKPAYLVLVTTLPGQVLLLLLLATVVFSLIKAVKLNRPLLM
jgi:hypothetical protein